MAEQMWVIQVGKGEQGPFSSNQIREFVRIGQVTAETPIRTARSADFVPAGRIKGLFPDQASTSAATAAVSTAAVSTAGASPATGATAASAEDAAPIPSPSDVFANFDTPSRSRSAPISLGGSSTAIGAIPPAKLPEVAYLLEAPPWQRLWPLAVLMLLMGWIIGGFLSFGRLYQPGSVLPVLMLGLGGIPLALAAIIFYLRPRRVPVGTAIMTSLFTGTCGIIMLLCLQWAAAATRHGVRIRGRGALLWMLLAAIGTAYHWTHSDSVVERWLGFVFGVGLCEEGTKLLPLVMLIIWHSDRRMSAHTFMFLGFVSGIGFGIGEAFYGYAPWNGNYGLDSNLIRWYSAVPSHAVYTTVCAAFLWKLADRLQSADGFWGRLGVVALAVGATAVVHGTYDTICTLGVVPSLIMEVLSFVLLIWAVRWGSSDTSEPTGQPATTWVEPLLKPRTMGIGLGVAALLLCAGIGLSSSREDVLPTILRAELPREIHPYINGITIAKGSDGLPLSGPISARFTLSLKEGVIIGVFTNTGAEALHGVVITCDNNEEVAHHVFAVGDLAAHADTVIDSAKGWSFEPREQVTIVADGVAPVKMTLP